MLLGMMAAYVTHQPLPVTSFTQLLNSPSVHSLDCYLCQCTARLQTVVHLCLMRHACYEDVLRIQQSILSPSPDCCGWQSARMKRPVIAESESLSVTVRNC